MKALTIAVVDDDDITLELVTHALETHLKATVYGFNHSRMARTFLLAQSSTSLDLIISDLNMPDYDGIAILQSCRSAGVDIPFMLLTAEATREIVLKARQAGAAYFLAKPFCTADLVEKVTSIVG